MEFISQIVYLFHKGGPVMYLLLICSLFAVAVAVERFLYYRSVANGSPAFLAKIAPLLERQKTAEASHLCEQMLPNALAAIVLAGLQAQQRGSQLENALESSAMLVAARLRERLDELSMIVTLAPLLGLLGTVIGMIQSFSVLNVQANQPMAITGGIGEALIATATGLIVATLALVLHSLFSYRVNRTVTEIEQTCAMVIGHLQTRKTVRRDAHEIA